MDCINQNIVSSEESISSDIGDEKKMLGINGDVVLESVSCIKQEDNEHPKSSYTDQQVQSGGKNTNTVCCPPIIHLNKLYVPWLMGHSQLRDVLESESCIKQEEDKEPRKSSYTDQQCSEVEAEIKEEPPDSYLETWQEELELVPVKEERNPELPFLIGDIEAEIFGDAAVPKTSANGSIDDKEILDGDTCPSVNGVVDLNGDSDRFLQGKTEHKTAEGTPQAIRKRRGRKPRHKRQLSDQPFQCQTCQKCFKKREHLRSHELFHSDERQFLCDTCGKGFYTNGDLKRHRVVHTGEKPYACPMCPKTFTQLCNMQSHLRKRCLIRGYGCDLCNRMFADKELLQKHKATHGTVPRCVNNVRKKRYCQDLPPFICDMCSLCFSNKRKLIAHIREHMQGVLCLDCEFCGKKCSTRRRLIVHMRTHTGEKPFSCSVCGRSFSQQCNLKKHEALHLPD